VKRRGNRRYYQHHEVILIRHIRELLYEQGFTISGARNRILSEGGGFMDSLENLSAEPEVEEIQEPSISSAEIKQELIGLIALLKV
jgi:DNA-binding transcriptional MerR regulator